jgi:hypothetical protein
VRKSDLLAELTGVMSDGIAQDLWILSIGIDNNPWGQYQLALNDTEVTQGLVVCPIKKMLLSGKKLMTSTLHMSTVRHFKTPAVHKYYRVFNLKVHHILI